MCGTEACVVAVAWYSITTNLPGSALCAQEGMPKKAPAWLLHAFVRTRTGAHTTHHIQPTVHQPSPQPAAPCVRSQLQSTILSHSSRGRHSAIYAARLARSIYVSCRSLRTSLRYAQCCLVCLPTRPCPDLHAARKRGLARDSTSWLCTAAGQQQKRLLLLPATPENGVVQQACCAPHPLPGM